MGNTAHTGEMQEIHYTTKKQHTQEKHRKYSTHRKHGKHSTHGKHSIHRVGQNHICTVYVPQTVYIQQFSREIIKCTVKFFNSDQPLVH
jgi:hypothetical protein